jgi:hypothetical protein
MKFEFTKEDKIEIIFTRNCQKWNPEPPKIKLK